MQEFLKDQNVVPRHPKKVSRSKQVTQAVNKYSGRILLAAALVAGVGGLSQYENKQRALAKQEQIEALNMQARFEETYRKISPAVADRIIRNFHAHDEAKPMIPVAKAAIEAGSGDRGVDPQEAQQLVEDAKAAEERLQALEGVLERSAEDAALYEKRLRLWNELCTKSGVTDAHHPRIQEVAREFTAQVKSEQPAPIRTASNPSTAKD